MTVSSDRSEHGERTRMSLGEVVTFLVKGSRKPLGVSHPSKIEDSFPQPVCSQKIV